MKIMNAKKIVMSFLNADEYQTDNEYKVITPYTIKNNGADSLQYISVHPQ